MGASHREEEEAGLKEGIRLQAGPGNKVVCTVRLNKPQTALCLKNPTGTTGGGSTEAMSIQAGMEDRENPLGSN